MKTIKEISAETFAQEVTDAARPVLVDFYAPWCGPCKMLTPVLEALGAEFEDRIQIVKVNVDEAPELANRYHVTSVPTLVLTQGGRTLDTIVGLNSTRALKSRLEKALPANAAPRPARATCFIS